MSTRSYGRLVLWSISLAIVLIATGDATAQPYWAQHYSGGGGTINTDHVYSVTATEDGGFVMAGFTSSFHGVWTFKLDDGGNLVWEKRLDLPGPLGAENLRSIDRTVDGGFIVAGKGPSGLFVMRLDCDGDLVWQKQYGSGTDFARSVKQTADGGYIVTGAYRSGTNREIWVLKLDASGNIQWQRGFGGAAEDFGMSVVEAPGGSGFAVLASTRSFGAGNADFLLLRLNSAGGILWAKTYGGPGDDGQNPVGVQGASIQQTSSGRFLLTGWTDSFGSGGGDAWLLQLDSSGNVQWEAAYGGALSDGAYQALEIPGSGYVVAGHVNASSSWGLRLDAVGNIVWQKDYAGSRAYGVELTRDGGFLFAGIDTGFVPERAYVFKTDADGDIDPSCTFIQNTALAATITSAVVGTPVVPSSNTVAGATSTSTTISNTTASIVTLCTGTGIFPLSVNLYAGLNWLALPTCSPLTRAEDLCADIGSAALSVTQQFPFAATWTYDCLSGTCTPVTAESGTCGSSCFCIDDGEGFEVMLSSPVTYVVQGTESEVPITYPAGGAEYLYSVPYDTFLVDADDLLTHTSPAQTVQRLIGATQSYESWDGAAGVNFRLIPGEAYRFANGPTTGGTLINPTLHRGPCPLPPCPAITQGGGYCITGSSTGQPYAWWVELDGSGTINGSEPVEYSAPPVLPVGSNASVLATFFATRINTQRNSSGVSAAAVGNCFTLTATTGTPELYVGPQNLPQTCKVLSGGCSYNPVIRKAADVDCAAGQCADTEGCTLDVCDSTSGLCLNIPTGDTDLDLICDELDNCPFATNSAQADADADLVGDVCDNCVQIFNPLQEPVELGQEIVAEDLVTFGWPDPVNARYVRGDLAVVGSYLTDLDQSLPLAVSFTDATSPLPGEGYYYLVRPDCPAGSWQNTAGAEPQRDLLLP